MRSAKPVSTPNDASLLKVRGARGNHHGIDMRRPVWRKKTIIVRNVRPASARPGASASASMFGQLARPGCAVPTGLGGIVLIAITI